MVSNCHTKIEQIWAELRKMGFRNETFATLGKVIDRLCDTICARSAWRKGFE